MLLESISTINVSIATKIKPIYRVLFFITTVLMSEDKRINLEQKDKRILPECKIDYDAIRGFILFETTQSSV
ncbi:hypothetical protein PcPA57_18760 [Pasteurella canis]|uniref:Uncharacterized protein n=1 Tax=Pasteurella canis TaxID=753 RepID=A0ABQ4VH95_9PAST|nr:hypothetical protein PA42_15700 [Pasteurella canis]GJJ81156.1 hypothetical protein PcPA57_18760 [Pasteurella canis]